MSALATARVWYVLRAVLSVLCEEKKKPSIAALSQTLPERLIKPTMRCPPSAAGIGAQPALAGDPFKKLRPVFARETNTIPVREQSHAEAEFPDRHHLPVSRRKNGPREPNKKNRFVTG
jgi:hypothetical protein